MKNPEKKYEEIESCVVNIGEIIEFEKRKIENRELLILCKDLGKIFTGKSDSHFYHEVAEAALNSLIKTKYAHEFLTNGNEIRNLNEILAPRAERLPTQTWRSTRQALFQQFSTPPAVAYLLVYQLNLKPSDQILEPSAGTGSLAVWAQGIGAKVYVNEIDSDRLSLLKILGFAPTSFDAEFINDYLPPTIVPDCVLMNPPFSANGGRTKNNSSKYGFRHVESALERLKKGGKFGIIMGEAAGLETKTGREFWGKMSDRIEVKAIIKINGCEYRRNGTSVDINLIIGNKRVEMINSDWRNSINQINSIKAKTVEEAFEFTDKLNLRLN